MTGARLYCADTSGTIRFCVAEDKERATEVLGAPAKKPSDDELRTFWHVAGLSAMTAEEAAQCVGVSRQTIWNWRQKAGGVNRVSTTEAWEARKAMVMSALETQTITGVSREMGVPRATVRKIARMAGMPKGGAHGRKAS